MLTIPATEMAFLFLYFCITFEFELETLIIVAERITLAEEIMNYTSCSSNLDFHYFYFLNNEFEMLVQTSYAIGIMVSMYTISLLCR